MQNVKGFKSISQLINFSVNKFHFSIHKNLQSLFIFPIFATVQ